jgi:hypothetical protein
MEKPGQSLLWYVSLKMGALVGWAIGFLVDQHMKDQEYTEELQQRAIDAKDNAASIDAYNDDRLAWRKAFYEFNKTPVADATAGYRKVHR